MTVTAFINYPLQDKNRKPYLEQGQEVKIGTVLLNVLDTVSGGKITTTEKVQRFRLQLKIQDVLDLGKETPAVFTISEMTLLVKTLEASEFLTPFIYGQLLRALQQYSNEE